MKVYFKHAKEIASKNKGIFFITSLMIALTSLLLFAAIIISYLGHQISQYLNNSQKVSILFDSNTPTAEINEFIKTYKDDPAVKRIYQKKPEEIMKEFLPSDYSIPPEDLIKIVRIDLNPKVDSTNLIKSILEKQASTENILEVIYLPQLYQKLKTISVWGNILSIITLGIFLTISILLIYITLKLGLEKLKKELQIMHDIGAPSSFLEKPLLITTFGMILLGQILNAIFITTFIYILYSIIHQLELENLLSIIIENLHLGIIFSVPFTFGLFVLQIIIYALVSKLFISKLIKSYKG